MSELPDPIADALRDTASEARIQRNWRAISRGRSKAPRRGRWIAVSAAVAMAAGLLLWLRSPSDGPLRTASGGAPPSTVTDTLALDDESVVTVTDGALELHRNDATHADWLLRSGSARFDVTPGGPRTWTVEIGLATVEVVGTSFEVERGDGWAEVRVSRGRVLVRGERVPDRVRALGAGESLRVTEPAPASAPAPAPASAPAPAPAPESGSASAPPSAPESGSGAGSGAGSEPGSGSGSESGSASVSADALLSEADAARARGDLSLASRLLRRAARLPNDPSSGLAAFTLGRLELGRHPDRAAEAFGWALERPLTPRLREDAAAYRVEALVATGDRTAAEVAARAYFARYPDGRHAARIRDTLPE